MAGGSGQVGPHGGPAVEASGGGAGTAVVPKTGGERARHRAPVNGGEHTEHGRRREVAAAAAASGGRHSRGSSRGVVAEVGKCQRPRHSNVQLDDADLGYLASGAKKVHTQKAEVVVQQACHLR